MNQNNTEALFNRFMSPYEAEQAREYRKALGIIKPVEELNGTFEGWKFRQVRYSDDSIEMVDSHRNLQP